MAGVAGIGEGSGDCHLRPVGVGDCDVDVVTGGAARISDHEIVGAGYEEAMSTTKADDHPADVIPLDPAKRRVARPDSAASCIAHGAGFNDISITNLSGGASASQFNTYCTGVADHAIPDNIPITFPSAIADC